MKLTNTFWMFGLGWMMILSFIYLYFEDWSFWPVYKIGSKIGFRMFKSTKNIVS